MGAITEKQAQFDEFTAERHSYAQQFHESVGTKSAIEGVIPQTELSNVSYVEGVFSYLVQHGLNGGDNRDGMDEARDFVWVSGYTFESPETSYQQPRPHVLFVGLTQYVGSDYFGGMHAYRPGMRLGAAKVEKGERYKSDDFAVAAKDIDDNHSTNVGRFPLAEFSMQQLEDDSFIESSRIKLEAQTALLKAGIETVIGE